MTIDKQKELRKELALLYGQDIKVLNKIKKLMSKKQDIDKRIKELEQEYEGIRNNDI